MKKTIFTFCSIALVCCAIIFACKKDDNSATHVGYASQMGTGTNPDPNHNSTSGVTTSTTTVPTNTNANVPTTTSFTVNGTAAQSAGAGETPGSGIYDVAITDATLGKINIDFNAKPTAGTYTINNNIPIANLQCEFGYLTPSSVSTAPSSGVVHVAVSSGLTTVYFSNIVCLDGSSPPNSYTVSGSIRF